MDFTTSSSQLFDSGSVTASPGKSPGKVQFTKKVFVHFGFLLVEAWCAFGIPFNCIADKRDQLAGDDAMPYLESVMADVRKREQNPKLVGDVAADSNVKGFPNCRQRVLTTWPKNDMWGEFLFKMSIRDAEAKNASEQLDCFYKAMMWPTPKGGQQQAGFMACLQLWYYGMPVDKVRFMI
jgi:hypothetical protein